MKYDKFMDAWTAYGNENVLPKGFGVKIVNILHLFDIYYDSPIEQILNVNKYDFLHTRHAGPVAWNVFEDFRDWWKLQDDKNEDEHKESQNRIYIDNDNIKHIIDIQKNFVEMYSDLIVPPAEFGENKCIDTEALTKYGSIREQCVHNLIELMKLKGDNEPIKEFFNITSAVEETQISATSISNAIHGRSKTAGGFKWKLKQ